MNKRKELYIGDQNIKGIDSLLACYFEDHLEESFGTAVLRKITNRLFERYGLSLQQSLQQFDIFEKVLNEFFGEGTKGVIKNLFESVCIIKKQKLNKKQASSFIEVQDETLGKFILQAYSDDDKKAILTAIADTALPIADLAKKSALPHSTAYRILNDLVKDGLISEVGEERKKKIYKATIREIQASVKGSKLVVSIFFSTEALRKSRVLATVAPKLIIPER